MAKEQKAGRTTPTSGEPIVIQDIKVALLNRGNQTIQTWFNNLKRAESSLYPDRREIYNTYLDATVDLHLDMLIDKRARAVKTTPFEWKELTNDLIKENFQSPWFMTFLDLIQKRIFFGTTLIEAQLSNGLIDDVLMIPRQNVKPEKGLITKDGYSERGAIAYNEGIYADYIFQIGRNNELGKLAYIVPYVLMKRQNLADFSRYNEMYGIDMRVYEYDPLKAGAREEMENSAKDYGSAAYIVVPKGMGSVLFPNSTNKQASAFAFDKLHQLCDEAMTVGVLGQSLTTGGQGGGSYNLGKVHKSVEEEINMEDRLIAEYIINYPFKKQILLKHGYRDLEKLKGCFKLHDELPKELKANMWIALSKNGLAIAEEDFYNEFGVPFPNGRPVVVAATPQTANEPLPPTNPNTPTGGKGESEKKKVKLSSLNAELATFYGHKCSHDKSPMRVTLGYKSELNTIIDSIIQRLKSGELKAGDVDPKLYNLTAEELWTGVQKGIGVKLEAASGTEYAMLKALRTNVYVFSGFKTYQFLKQASELLVDADGKVKAFSVFRDEVLALNSQYNIEYLRTEYNYAIASSRMAGKWAQFEANKGTLPLLQYETVGDARVRAAHAALDGIIKPVGDDFWNQYLPPNSWNCRCTVRQLAEGTVSDTKPENLPQLTEMFKTNAGKSKVIFPPSHPYYNVDAGDKNFDLPIPD
jgi:SPP1 gp7 family putative phage head morphogenesis protein